MTEPVRTGFVSLIGRPNVGKSSLVNQVIGCHVCITSSRPQTTRHRVLGIKSTADSQIVFVDTPGVDSRHKKAINRAVNLCAAKSLRGVDLVALVIGAKGWVGEDDEPLELVKRQSGPSILIINKVDLLKDKAMLLPLIQASQQKMQFAEIVPVSAKTGDNVDHMVNVIGRHLPLAEPGFPEDQITDKGDRFIASELVREQLFRQLGEELPYATAVEIDRFDISETLIRISAIIFVEKSGQKAIVIGQGGRRLKLIGSAARAQMQHRWQCHVHLGLWVKVRSGWANDPVALRDLGYWEAS